MKKILYVVLLLNSCATFWLSYAEYAGVECPAGQTPYWYSHPLLSGWKCRPAHKGESGVLNPEDQRRAMKESTREASKPPVDYEEEDLNA